MPRTYGSWFRVVAVSEAISWTGLLIAMIFKYRYGQPLGVTIMGWIHGLAFTAYVATSLIVFSPLRWRLRVLVLALIASIPPLTSVAFERWATARGLMQQQESPEPTFWARVRHVLRELN